MESIDLFESCSHYNVNLLNCSNETVNALMDAFVVEQGEINVRLSKSLIDKFEIPTDAIDWDSYEVDTDMLEGELEYFVGNHPQYLVIANNCRWNSETGYMFTDNLVKTVSRDYDITLTITEDGQDAIKCRESSHDAPTGHTTYIVGLSNEEYEKLEEAELNELIKFAESKF